MIDLGFPLGILACALLGAYLDARRDRLTIATGASVEPESTRPALVVECHGSTHPLLSGVGSGCARRAGRPVPQQRLSSFRGVAE